MGKYADGAVKTAKEQKMVLVNLEINGQYAKQSSGTISGPVGPKMAKRIWKLWAQMCDQSVRMK